MPALQSRHCSAGHPGRLLADRPKEPGVGALIGGHASAACLRLVAIALAVGLLTLPNGRQDESWSEAPCQSNEGSRSPTGLHWEFRAPHILELCPPDLGMTLL